MHQERPIQKARRVAPPGLGGGAPRTVAARRDVERPRPRRGHVPTRTPRGEAVAWWERPMPPETLDPHAWAMCRELARVLHATGRYRVSALARRCADLGTPHRRETISRVLNGAQPPSQRLVEDLARAAGVDLAYLIVEV